MVNVEVFSLWLDSMILRVIFNLNDSIVHGEQGENTRIYISWWMRAQKLFIDGWGAQSISSETTGNNGTLLRISHYFVTWYIVV